MIKIGLNDYFENERRKGNLGASKAATNQTAKKSASNIEGVTNWEDSAVQEGWAEGYQSPGAYYDYFFSGQDIKVTIDGVEDDYPDIPIVNFAFNVEQQKTPVYGMWSYTYDGVMRGTRLVSGTFTIATKSTGYMRDLLAKAARSRQDIASGVNTPGQQLYSGRALTADDENIAKYWSRNIDPNLSSAGKNMFSVHPPFSFVVLYGIQDTSVTAGEWSDAIAGADGNNILTQDMNERLVMPASNTGASWFNPSGETNRYVLEACELQSMQTGAAPDGAVVSETYQFFARDLIISTVR